MHPGAREELRQGAHCIKIMGSGGVASPTDPIWMNQYREDEIRAIVNECTERRTYVAAHCHPASAVRRCVEFGVRSIEHGTLIDDETARFVAAKGAYIVPTMVDHLRAGRDWAASSDFRRRARKRPSTRSSRRCRAWTRCAAPASRSASAPTCWARTYEQECREFTLRSEVFSPLEILRQATSINAEMMMMQGQIGCVAPGAYADLLVVDGDPLKDISLLAANGRNLRAIVRAGEIVKNELR